MKKVRLQRTLHLVAKAIAIIGLLLWSNKAF
jgi:hypothetical protein